MTISEKRELLEKEIVVAESLLKDNIENYTVGDFMPSFGEILSSTPAVVQEHPTDIIKIASIVSQQVLSDEHMINRVLSYVKQGLFIASLWKRA